MSLDLVELNELSELILDNIDKIEDSEFAQRIVENSDNFNLEHKQIFIICAEFFRMNNKYPDKEFLENNGYIKNELEGDVEIERKKFSLSLALDFVNRIHTVNIQVEAGQALELGDFDKVQELISKVELNNSIALDGDWKNHKSQEDDTEWIVEGWLPRGKLTLLAGPGGTGKSRGALQLACGVALNYKNWLGEDGPKISLAQRETVVYVSWEQEKQELAFRLPEWVRMEELHNRLFFVNPNESSLWNNGKRTTYLSNLLNQIKDLKAALVILDPLAAAFLGNENDRAEVRAFLGELARWTKEADCTVLIVSHPPKNGADYSGSTDWVNATRSVWTISKKIRDDQGRPQKRGNSVKDRESPDAVCLESIKSTYAKQPDPIWLKDEFPLWQAADFNEAAYEQMSDEQQEAARLKRIEDTKEVSKELNSHD